MPARYRYEFKTVFGTGSIPLLLRAIMNSRDLAGMRVTCVLEGLELGGAERQAIQLMHHLSTACGVDARVWAFRLPGTAAQLCDSLGIPWAVQVNGQQWRKSLWSMARFAHTLRRHRPHVLLPFTLWPNIACGLFRRWTGAAVCIWNQRDALLPAPGMLLKTAMCGCHAFICNSQHSADLLQRQCNIPDRQLHVVRNAVQLPAPLMSRQVWRDALGTTGTDIICTMVANLNNSKDHTTLLHAWRIVQSTRPDLRGVLVLAGRFGSAAEHIKALVHGLGVEQSVRLPGHVKDISGLLAATDLGVYSSRSEGCPNGILECMASGLAVVCTENPGAFEAIGSIAPECTSPAGNPETLAVLIARFMEDRDLRSAIGNSNLERVERCFSPRLVHESFTGLIHKTLHSAQ